MNLFIDTPQRAAERMERERLASRVGAPSPAAAVSPAARQGGGAVEVTDGAGGAAAPATASGACYSVAQEAYEEEKAYDRRRTRRKKLVAFLRVAALVVLVPLGIALIFLCSYALTCILNGASPAELAQLMAELFSCVKTFALEVVALL